MFKLSRLDKPWNAPAGPHRHGNNAWGPASSKVQEMHDRLRSIVDGVARGEKIYIKIEGGKYDQSIGRIAKILDEDIVLNKRDEGTSREWHEWKFSLKARLQFDSPKRSTATLGLVSWSGITAYVLDDYTGDTVNTGVELKAIAEKAASQPVYDVCGRLLEVGDTVLYINSRYGGGSQLSFGVLKEIKARADRYRNQLSTETTVVVSNIAGDEISKIKNPSSYILNAKGTDIEKLATMKALVDTNS